MEADEDEDEDMFLRLRFLTRFLVRGFSGDMRV